MIYKIKEIFFKLLELILIQSFPKIALNFPTYKSDLKNFWGGMQKIAKKFNK